MCNIIDKKLIVYIGIVYILLKSDIYIRYLVVCIFILGICY